MTSFKNLKINAKILVSNLISMAFLLLVAGYGFYQLNASINALQDIYENRIIPLKQMNIVSRDLMQIRVNMLTELIALQEGDKAEVRRRIEDSDRLKKEMEEQLAAFEKTVLTEEEARRYADFRAADTAGADIRTRFREAIERGQEEEARRLSVQWRDNYRQMRDHINRIVDIQSEVAQQLYEEEVTAFKITVVVFTVIIVLSVTAALTILTLMRRYISTPLQNAVDRVRDLAEGEGDLTKRLEVNSTDEVGDMAKWINQFISNIHDIVKEMSSNTNDVKASAGSLTGASQNLSAGMEEMSVQSRNISAAATQMNQNFQVISSSVEELSTSVGEVARNASDASKIAREADKTANETNQKIKQLGVDAQEIGKVVEAIQGIASQTNLLALNAAIEAAGAGDAGKGFAVVASEVKELARQAAEASDEIKTRIEAIQNSTEMAVESISMITSVISKINEFSTSIASSVEEQSITAKEIAGNVNQSAQASSDVVQNITGISTATQDGAKNAQSLSGLATQLDTLSSRLGQIVSRFRI